MRHSPIPTRYRHVGDPPATGELGHAATRGFFDFDTRRERGRPTSIRVVTVTFSPVSPQQLQHIFPSDVDGPIGLDFPRAMAVP